MMVMTGMSYPKAFWISFSIRPGQSAETMSPPTVSEWLEMLVMSIAARPS